MTNRTFEIADEKGRKRTVTLAQYRAELDAAAALAKPIMAAWRRGDLAACEAAQTNMRKTTSIQRDVHGDPLPNRSRIWG